MSIAGMMKTGWTSALHRVAFVTVLSVTIIGCRVQPLEPARPAGSPPTVATSAPQEAVTVAGKLDHQSVPFRLERGNYLVAWSVTPWPGDGGCVAYPALQSSDDPRVRRPLVLPIDSKTATSGTARLSEVQAGQYYVAGGSTCQDWTITLAPG